MPVISVFFGITIRMYFDDHPPAHIHATYQGQEALVAIESGEVIAGNLPRKAAALVKDWCLNHRDDLASNWVKGQALQPMERIPGADND